MNLSPQQNKELSEFPKALRDLVDAELAVGNTIVELGHGFPAAPCGAYIKLSQPVSARPGSTAELSFYDRNGSDYSGEFTDEKRHYFVLEPPHAPEPEPDMQAIRAKLDADYIAANLSFFGPDATVEGVIQAQFDRAVARATPEDPNSLVGRFKASMDIDYEKWREGIGYDIGLFGQATPQELQQIEQILRERRDVDWRDIAALAALGTKSAKRALKLALSTGDARIRMAVLTHAPQLVSKSDRITALVTTLEKASLYSGLSEALRHIEQFHPREIVNALLRGLMERDGGTACQFAAMLYFIHGKASSAFDWDHRPFFLRFNTADLVEREVVVRELLATLGVKPSRYIKPKPI